MSWIKDLLGFGKTEAEIEAEAFPPVGGTDKQQFSFVYTHKHWIDNIEVAHHITGEVDLGIIYYSGNVQRWSLLFSNIVYDWELPCLPETYLFFNCVKRIECYVDKHGHLLEDLEPISQNILLKQKKKDIYAYVKDSKHADNLSHLFTYNLKEPEFIREILAVNPVFRMLINTMLVCNLQNDTTSADQIPQPYPINNYFGNEAVLPLKACWIKKPAKTAGDLDTWLRVGGLDDEKYKVQNLHEFLSQASGKFNIENTIAVDFSELYNFKSDAQVNTTSLQYAEGYLETIVPEAWYKEEQVILQATGIHGREERSDG